jgi:hypothetical protein
MAKQIIVIPAYNEEATVAQVVRDAVRVADVVVVDKPPRALPPKIPEAAKLPLPTK